MLTVRLTQAIEAIADYLKLERDALEDLTVMGLRPIAKTLGIVGLSRLKKHELVEAIDKELTQLRSMVAADKAEQEEGAKLIEAAKEGDYLVPIGEVAEKVYKRLREVVTTAESLQAAKEEVNGLVATVARQEMSHYEFSTVRSRRYDIKRLLDAQVAQEGLLKRDLGDLVEYFYAQFLSFQRTDAIALSKKYKSGLNQKHRDPVQVEAISLYRDALRTLEELPDELARVREGKKPRRGFWKPVSHAAILGTGRRMCEVHCLGEFERIGEYSLLFSGQAKTRDAEGSRDSYEIPTLFPASLMVEAIAYLDLCGKRLEKEEQLRDRKACNRAFSVELSRQTRSYKVLLGDRSYTYEESRKLYFQVMWGIFSDSGIVTRDFTKCSDWLGHQDKDGATDTTFLSYLKYHILDLEAVKGLLDRQGIVKDAVELHKN